MTDPTIPAQISARPDKDQNMTTTPIPELPEPSLKQLAGRLQSAAYHHGEIDARDHSDDKHAEAGDRSYAALTALLTRAARLEAELVKCREYSARLDYLDVRNDAKNKKNRTLYGWRLSENHNRIALEDHNYPALDVRAAIDTARKGTTS